MGWTVIISDLANFRFMTQHTGRQSGVFQYAYHVMSLLIHALSPPTSLPLSLSFSFDTCLLVRKDIFQKVILSDIVPHGLPNMFFGKNILFSNDNDWRFFRRTCTPAFKHGWDLGVFEVTSQRLVDQWSKLESKDIPLGPWFAR